MQDTAASALGSLAIEKLAIESVERPRLTEMVQRRLSQMIASGVWQPGDLVPSEGDLARRFGVSKPTIREAMRQLAALGLLEIRQGKPASVRTLSHEPMEQFFRFALESDPDGLRSLMELRRAIETQTVMLAALRITEPELEEVRRLIGVLGANKTRDESWAPTHAAFHLALVRGAGNRVAANLLLALKDVIERSSRMVRAAPLDPSFETTFGRHVAILEAVEARDPQGARAAMERHFDAVDRVIAAMPRPEPPMPDAPAP